MLVLTDRANLSDDSGSFVDSSAPLMMNRIHLPGGFLRWKIIKRIAVPAEGHQMPRRCSDPQIWRGSCPVGRVRVCW